MNPTGEPAAPGARHVAVVIPARNEAATIGTCLRSVLRAMTSAAATGPVVAVAHRCTDRTAAIATQVLGDRGIVIQDDSPHVSGVRRRGVEAALQLLGPDAHDAWLLSTDADSSVPVTWVRSILRHADDGADAVAGMVRLDAWHGMSPLGRRAYRALVAAGMDASSHRHAYAANLAVSVQAYRQIGGWPPVESAEEHALLKHLERAGKRVLRPTHPVVTTSGRHRGRARGGLGDLLGSLDVTGAGAGETTDGTAR